MDVYTQGELREGTFLMDAANMTQHPVIHVVSHVLEDLMGGSLDLATF